MYFKNPPQSTSNIRIHFKHTYFLVTTTPLPQLLAPCHRQKKATRALAQSEVEQKTADNSRAPIGQFCQWVVSDGATLLLDWLFTTSFSIYLSQTTMQKGQSFSDISHPLLTLNGGFYQTIHDKPCLSTQTQIFVFLSLCICCALK